MQKRRPHKARRGHDAVAQRQLPCHRQYAGDMLVDVKRMIDTALIKPATRCQLGHGGADKFGVAQHGVSPVAGRKDALKLNAHTLARHGIEQRRTFGQSLFRRGFNHKVQATGKAHRAQHTQGVLIKTALGITDGTNQLAVQIALAVVAIDKAALGMPRHGINGKIAARQIVLKRSGALHTLGMTTVGIEAVQAVGGDLNALAIANSRNAAEFNTRFNHGDIRSLERRFGLLPQAAATHVHIVAGAPHQGITYPTAYVPSLKTSCLERAQNTNGGIGRLRTVERNIAHAYGLL